MINNIMKKLMIATVTATTLLSTFAIPAWAGSWYNVSCEYEVGAGYIGVYRSGYGGGDYYRTVVFGDRYCPHSID